RGAVNDIVERTGREPAKYVLFTNIHLSLASKRTLERAIREEYDRAVEVGILGAGELAPILNNLPHLRSAFFATASFATWRTAWDGHQKATPMAPPALLVGRMVEGDSTRQAVDSDSNRVLVISGPPGIGKTRLAFAATEHRPLETLVALDPLSLSI